MKTVLCFGDSLTWGFTPGTGVRHRYQDRWTSVLQKGLGHGVRVIPEGLPGRTTAFDDHTTPVDLNGARILPTLLQTHSPLDLVVLLLGTNDLKAHVGGNAFAAERGMRRLIQIIQCHDFGPGGTRPFILIVAPPHVVETGDPERDVYLEPHRSEVTKIGPIYRSIAEQTGCSFFDASSVAKPSTIDGVHLEAEQTRAIGSAVLPIAETILQS